MQSAFGRILQQFVAENAGESTICGVTTPPEVRLGQLFGV
jgi:hypothetical protein